MRFGIPALFLALAGCSAPVVQMYERPTLAPSQHALVRVEDRGIDLTRERVEFQQVDGKPTLGVSEGILNTSTGAQAVYMLPGKPTLQLRDRGGLAPALPGTSGWSPSRVAPTSSRAG